jgi:hypothetical protein
VCDVLTGLCGQAGAPVRNLRGRQSGHGLDFVRQAVGRLAHAPYGLAWRAGEVVRLAPELPEGYIPRFWGRS